MIAEALFPFDLWISWTHRLFGWHWAAVPLESEDGGFFYRALRIRTDSDGREYVVDHDGEAIFLDDAGEVRRLT